MLKKRNITITVGEFLKENDFSIPIDQRDYVWGKSQADALFHSMKYAMELRNQDPLYVEELGRHIIYIDELGTQWIYDGQQRTITIILLNRAIINKMYDIRNQSDVATSKYDKIIKEIANDYLTTRAGRNILSFSNDDNTFFSKMIEGLDSTQPIIDKENRKPKTYRNHSQQSYLDVYNNFYSNLTDMVKDLDTDHAKLKCLNSLIDTILNGSQFDYPRIEHDPDIARRLFINLNKNGCKMSQSDIVKVSLLSRIGHSKSNEKDKEIFQRDWNTMSNRLGPNRKKAYSITAMMRHVFNVKYMSGIKILNEPNLANAVEAHLSSFDDENDAKSAVHEFMSDLNAFVDPFYAAQYGNVLINSRNYTENNNLAESLSLLKDLNYGQHLPVLCALSLSNWNDGDKYEVYNLIEKYSVIKGKIMNSRDDLTEANFIALARYILRSKYRTVDEIKSYFRDNFPIKLKDLNYHLSEYSFKTSNNNLTSDSRVLFKYLFTLLHNSSDSETRVNANNITCEHILSRSLVDDYQDYGFNSIDDFNEHIHSLGNLTPLSSYDNSKVGNNDFSRKKKVYSNSNIQTTRELLEYDTWNKESIISRSHTLSNALCDLLWVF